MKADPYINVDPGTMSPYQHGEVFVTDDGAENDLDLGHYERFTSARMTRMGCQFHPEFKSSPLSPHPLFTRFVRGAMERRHERTTKGTITAASVS